VRKSTFFFLFSMVMLTSCEPTGRTPETVVIVSLDTTRRDQVSVYGHPLRTTPSLEALADDGVVFDQAIAVHTNTAPSHASMLTGLYPPAHGSINNGVPIFKGVPTLGETLSRHGFATAAFVSGKTLKAEVCGLERGFSLYDDRFEGWERRACATLRLTTRWLRRQNPQQPVFLFFHLFDPHFLYSPPPEFGSFGLDGRPIPPEPLTVDKLRQETQRDNRLWQQNVDEWTRRYDGEIAYADWAVGELMATLKEIGRYSKALIVVVSDHGETLAERPRVFDHGSRVTEEQIRIPLIVKFPDRSLAGRRVDHQVSQIDIVPTVLRQFDLPRLTSTPGIDLHRLAQDPSIPERPLFCMARREPERLTDLGFEVPGQHRWDGPESMLVAVRLPPHKLVDYAFLEDRDLRRLRDLVNDPAERKFFKNPEVETRLGRLLDHWWLRNWSGETSSNALLSPETTRMLEGLGYLDPSTEADDRTEPEEDSAAVFGSGFENGSPSEWSRVPK